jgi:haloalkane dehalogenase
MIRPTHAHGMKDIRALDSHMAYRDVGSDGPAVVFLHGNPTSSHLWRNVLPRVAAAAHCLAPDLIGMGQSGKPNIDYRFADHARYLDAWFDAALPSNEPVVLVGHDWGGVLALDWAARHPSRVKGAAVFETFLRPMSWSQWPAEGEKLFRALRTPGVGEQMVLEENQFLARSLAHGVKSGLSAEDRAVYYAPYPDAASRRPLLQWPREIPIDGSPADVATVIERNAAWLASSAAAKLLITFATPSPLGNGVAEWVRVHARSMQVEALGPAGHHAPEDMPVEIAETLLRWLRAAV